MFNHYDPYENMTPEQKKEHIENVRAANQKRIQTQIAESHSDKLNTIIELLIEIRDRITPKYTITVTDSSTTPIEPKPDDNE